MMNYDDDFFSVEEATLSDIWHYGVGHEDGGHSGRYPWGSGNDNFQRPTDFYSYVINLKNKGVSETDIAKGLNMSTTELRAYYGVSGVLRRKELVEAAKRLKERGVDEDGNPITNEKIGIILGEKYEGGKPIGESTIRSFLDADREARKNAALVTADRLMKSVDEKGMIDVGTIVEKELGVSADKLNQALAIAEAEGYVILHGSVEQVAHPGQRINYRLLAPKGTPKNAAYDYANIHQITEYYSEDNGKSFRESFHYPKAMNPDRVMIRYAEEGGKNKDGVIEVRRGVQDLSLGGANYAQVRILVDNGGGINDKYLKGMAVYSDGHDMPEGVDIIFNTNKPLGTPKMKVLKSVEDNLKKDPSNPFGATIKEHGGQNYYDDPNGEFTDPITGNKQSLGLINKRAEAGEWGGWSKEIPSQMLSKQPKATIGKQLAKSVKNRQEEYDEIMSIDNPTVKAKLLEDFANNCDKASVDLKAASFPGTLYHVILPSTTLKDNEVYAPNFKDGTQLALVRFPHGGTFEIPIVTVNNRNKECAEMIGPDAKDAIGINANVASRLSGADFDGDTVLTIPTNQGGVNIKSTDPLEGLKNFDTGEYGPSEVRKDANGIEHYYRNGVEYKHINEEFKQKQMGVVSNLITDMTLKGATPDELARAVRHSMVVIDSYKHHLDYQQSKIDNNIQELIDKYQKHEHDEGSGGVSTLISRAKNVSQVNKRAPGQFILDQKDNPDNGHILTLVDPQNKVYLDPKTNKEYSEKDKKTIYIDPKSGEKLYHETREAYTKVKLVNEDGIKVQVPAYIKEGDKYVRPRYYVDDEHKTEVYFKDSKGNFQKVKDKNDVKSILSVESVPKMALVKDAKELSSGTIQEEYYAEYANRLKQMANQARLDYLYFNDHPIPYSPSAVKEYKDEVKSLEDKVRNAELNAPKERASNILATSIVKQKIDASDEELSKEDIQKLKQNELTKARSRYGAHNARFIITEKEWEAVQKGAFSKNRLEQILRYADQDVVRKLATPHDEIKLSDADIRRIKGLSAKGETNAAIAARMHVSLSTVIKYLGQED